MNQHEPIPPLAILTAMIEQNKDAYGRVRGALDQSVQETCANWVPVFPNLYDMDQNVLAGDVRQLSSFYLLASPEFKKSGLRLSRGGNCSIVLSARRSPRHSIRKHPRNLATAELLRSTEYPSLTLFGEDYGTVPWKPYITWVADLKRQVLQNAWLAAISNIRSHTKTVVFDMVDLPPAIMPTIGTGKPQAEDTEAGQWPEWENEKGGDSPA